MDRKIIRKLLIGIITAALTLGLAGCVKPAVSDKEAEVTDAAPEEITFTDAL